MCIYNADDSHSGRADHSYIPNGASFAYGVCCPVVWNHSSHTLILSVVQFNQYSIFKMGKLTQGQKALFLWKSPLAKLQ